MSRSRKQLKETFQGINEFWKEEHYQTCLFEWDHIQTFISKEPTPYQCGNCDTYWTKVFYVNDHYNICPNCDTWCDPFLCNPINYSSVLEYIDTRWHFYLLPKDLFYCKKCYATDIPTEDYCYRCYSKKLTTPSI